MSNFLTVAALCLSLPFAVGCSETEEAHPEGEHTHADGTTHNPSEANDDHAMELEEKGALDLGSVTVGGATFALDATGPATPGSVATLNIALTAGTMPETIRLWYGIESGVGSLKAKGDIHDDHLHADVEIPEGAMESPALWLETVSAGGEKAASSLPY